MLSLLLSVKLLSIDGLLLGKLLITIPLETSVILRSISCPLYDGTNLIWQPTYDSSILGINKLDIVEIVYVIVAEAIISSLNS